MIGALMLRVRAFLSAPELLTALQQARNGLRYWEPNTQYGAVENARINGLVERAIRRIEGDGR